MVWHLSYFNKTNFYFSKKSVAFLYIQNHPMVRHSLNKLHLREYSRWRANYSHVPYKSGNHGRRHGLWPERNLVILFNDVANFLSVGSGWRFDSVQSLAISLCPFRPTIGAGSFIDAPQFLYKKGCSIFKTSKTISVSYGAFWCIFMELISTHMKNK